MTEQRTIYQIISDVMRDVQAVGKDSKNTDQHYKFRGIDAVVNAVGPKFREHGVVPAPMLETAGYRDVTTSRGKPSRECTVQVRYRFHGPTGDHLDVIVPGESMDFGDKGTAKAMSVAYRIALLQLLCIPTDDPDPDSESYERGTQVNPELFEIGPEATELRDKANNAPSLDTLKGVWDSTTEAADKRIISPGEFTWLKGVINKAKSAMEAAEVAS